MPQDELPAASAVEPRKATSRSAAAQRALDEAAARRRLASEQAPAVEIGGRDGPEPVRYGDWEVKGLASDF